MVQEVRKKQHGRKKKIREIIQIKQMKKIGADSGADSGQIPLVNDGLHR
jgi:hypothetical protein